MKRRRNNWDRLLDLAEVGKRKPKSSDLLAARHQELAVEVRNLFLMGPNALRKRYDAEFSPPAGLIV